VCRARSRGQIDHSEKHRSPTRNSRNRAHFAARTRRNFLSFSSLLLQGEVGKAIVVALPAAYRTAITP
jgi:hypothetical protein